MLGNCSHLDSYFFSVYNFTWLMSKHFHSVLLAFQIERRLLQNLTKVRISLTFSFSWGQHWRCDTFLQCSQYRACRTKFRVPPHKCNQTVGNKSGEYSAKRKMSKPAATSNSGGRGASLVLHSKYSRLYSWSCDDIMCSAFDGASSSQQNEGYFVVWIPWLQHRYINFTFIILSQPDSTTSIQISEYQRSHTR